MFICIKINIRLFGHAIHQYSLPSILSHHNLEHLILHIAETSYLTLHELDCKSSE